MQHHFNKTRKTLQRKFGSKEDKDVITADADLDAKVIVFKSISITCRDLYKIIDRYRDRISILSQEECIFGQFLKDFGKRSRSFGKNIMSSGDAVAYSGQQRKCMRIPLLRLQHDVEVFQTRAVRDTYATLNIMENGRTDYRDALSWMKSASVQLDPDTGKGLDRFRSAQSHVRNAKRIFDCISLDSMQKIDLLAAARCNMYSHALVLYMSELLQLSKKTSNIFEEVITAIVISPRYDFCLLKDLSENEECNRNQKDQLIIFSNQNADKGNAKSEEKLKTYTSSMHGLNFQQAEENVEKLPCTKSFCMKSDPSYFSTDMNSRAERYKSFSVLSSNNKSSASPGVENRHKNLRSTKLHAFTSFFAELDPLEKPKEFEFKLNVDKITSQQT